MKISIITFGFPYPRPGKLLGVELFVKNLAIQLKNLGNDIKIVTTYWNGGKRYDNYKGIPILRILDSKAILGKFGSIFQLNFMTFGLNLIRKKNFKFYRDSDIIILCFGIGFSGFFKLKKIPIISIFFHYDIPKSITDYLTIPFLHHLEKIQYKKHKNIITLSNSSKIDIMKKLGIEEKNIKVIPVGVDTNRFNSSNRSIKIKEKYGNKILLYLGLMIHRKRVPILLKAMLKVYKRFPEVKLILIGRGIYLNRYKNYAQRLKIEKNLIWKEWVDRPEIFYASSDIFVFPSESEGFGQVIIEAMACGIPVICANIPPMSEIIENGGITFNLNDPNDLAEKIIYLLKDKERRLLLGKNALNIIKKKYEWLHIAETYIDFLKKIHRLNYSK